MSNNIDLFQAYKDFSNPDIDASIALYNYQANFGLLGDSDIVNYMSLACSKQASICQYTEIHVNDFVIDFDGKRKIIKDEIDVSQLFGRNVRVKMQDHTDATKTETNEVEVYIPEIIHVTLQDNTRLGQGYQISWNADPLNEKGVFLLLLYHPLENNTLAPQYKDPITNYLEVEDTGSYTFSKTDFPEIPDNSLITLKVMRGNFDVAEIDITSSDLVRVFGLTESTGYLKLI
ncbi:MAG: hypothetical protein R2795_12530 [Saprospiraceae bacterium]